MSVASFVFTSLLQWHYVNLSSKNHWMPQADLRMDGALI